jgi:outer membrane biosynthesis protein TonB
MIFLFRKRVFIVLASTLLLSAVTAQCEIASETQPADVTVSDERAYVSVGTDMKSYDIISKEKPEVYDAYTRPYKDITKKSPKEYGAYYDTIRQKILRRLKRNYTRHYNNGDVYLFFILDKTGALARIDVSLGMSTKDSALIDIALSSLQQAAPFDPFPKGLDAPRMPFSVTVTFKKE